MSFILIGLLTIVAIAIVWLVVQYLKEQRKDKTILDEYYRKKRAARFRKRGMQIKTKQYQRTKENT